MPQEELKSKLALSARTFSVCLERLLADQTVAADANLLRLPEHSVRFAPQQQAVVERFFATLSQSPYAPPSRADMAALLGDDVLAALLEQGKLVKVRDDVLFGADAYKAMVDGVIAQLKLHGRTNVADVRDLFNTSRRYAIALLEYLDQEHVTRRDGDDRVLW
jgi:selenocysteine-specific elongation factor